MPISSSIDEPRNLTIFAVKGNLSFEEQMDVLREFYSGDPTANVLWDFSLMEGNRLSSEELEDLFAYIEANKGRRPQGKTALLVTTELDFGLSRVSESYALIKELPWEIRAFRSIDDALKWIDGKIVWDEKTNSFRKA